MKITNIKIRNFRLLDNVEINLEEITTAIVGKNNSGKTSFSEIFNVFMNNKKFEFEDFSMTSHQSFSVLISYIRKLLQKIKKIKSKRF